MRYVSVNGTVTAENPLTIDRPHTLVNRTKLPERFTIALDRITSVVLLPELTPGWGSLSIAVDGLPAPLPTVQALSVDPATVIFAADELPAFSALADWLRHVAQVNAAAQPEDGLLGIRNASAGSTGLDFEAEAAGLLPDSAQSTLKEMGAQLWQAGDSARDTWAMILRSPDFLQIALSTAATPLNVVPLFEALVARGTDSCIEVLVDLPAQRKPWPKNDDIDYARRAIARAEKRQAEEQRLALEPSTSEAAVQDRIDSYVLLTGHYKRNAVVAGDLQRGDLQTGREIYALYGVPAHYDAQELWVIAQPRPTGNAMVVAVIGRVRSDQLLPRWPGMNAAMCAARALFVSRLLSRAADLLPEDASIIEALARLHTPQTRAELESLDGLGGDFGDQVAEWLIASAEYGLPSRGERPGMPEPRMVKGHAAAEIYAAEVLAALGFSGVRRTPTGVDGGIDVVGDDVVAQVKMEALPTGRDRIQALAGIARVENVHAVFFTLAGYTAPAVDWADRAGVALLEFETDGTVGAANSLGRRLLADGAAGLT